MTYLARQRRCCGAAKGSKGIKCPPIVLRATSLLLIVMPDEVEGPAIAGGTFTLVDGVPTPDDEGPAPLDKDWRG